MAGDGRERLPKALGLVQVVLLSTSLMLVVFGMLVLVAERMPSTLALGLGMVALDEWEHELAAFPVR